MLVAHCAGLGVALFIGLAKWFDAGGIVEFLQAAAVGCFVSSLVTFPCSVVQMVVRAFRDRRP